MQTPPARVSALAARFERELARQEARMEHEAQIQLAQAAEAASLSPGAIATPPAVAAVATDDVGSSRQEQRALEPARDGAPPPAGLRAVDAPLTVDDDARALLADLDRARTHLASSLAAAEDDPALRCGPYVLLEAVARDGVGQLHRAWDRAAQRFVAVRTVERQDGEGGRLQVHPEAHRALDRARHLRHPNLLTLLDHGVEPDGRLWLAYELTPGRTLEPRPGEPCRRSPAEAARLVRDAARGLAYARGLGLVHGGLTPASILVDRGHRARVLDLGLGLLEVSTGGGAARLARRLDRAACRAPELVTGSIADVRGDVYALGAILHRLLTGQPPSDGLDEPSTDAALDAVCARCVHPDPARRYAYAGDLARDLDRWLHGESPRAVDDLGGSVGLVLRRALDAVTNLFAG